MRVYDRGIESPYTSYNLLHAIKGYKNKNWPIKSSFYKIRDPMINGRGPSADDLFAKPDIAAEARDSVYV